jgi:hypothetical protein
MPNETNWQDITRRLDINPASVTTDSPLSKNRGRGRAIAKVPTRLVIPSITFSAVLDFGLPLYSFQPSVILAQFNYSHTADFRLLHPVFPLLTSMTPVPFMCIRYRVGGTVYRYLIPCSSASPGLSALFMQQIRLSCPLYAGQLIKKHCVIECYILTGISAANYNTYPELFFETNRLNLPSSSDEVFVDINPTVTLLRSDMTVAIVPTEAIPTTYNDNISWLTN